MEELQPGEAVLVLVLEDFPAFLLFGEFLAESDINLRELLLQCGERLLDRGLQAWQNMVLQGPTELLLDHSFDRRRRQRRAALLLQRGLLLDDLLEQIFDLGLDPRENDLGQLVVDGLESLGQQGHDDVPNLLADDLVSDVVLDGLLDRALNLRLLLLLPGEELLELVRLLGQLLVLPCELAEVVDNLLLLELLELLLARLAD